MLSGGNFKVQESWDQFGVNCTPNQEIKINNSSIEAESCNLLQCVVDSG